MKRVLVLGVLSFFAGAVLAVMEDRRSRLDEPYEDDPNWPPVVGRPTDAQQPVPDQGESLGAANEPQSMKAQPATPRARRVRSANGNAAGASQATNGTAGDPPPPAARRQARRRRGEGSQPS